MDPQILDLFWDIYQSLQNHLTYDEFRDELRKRLREKLFKLTESELRKVSE